MSDHKESERQDSASADELVRLRGELQALKTNYSQTQVENEKLKNNIANLESIIAMMPGHVYLKNLHGVYQLCNDHVAKVLHLGHRDNIKGKTDHDIVKQPYADMVVQNDAAIMQAGEVTSLEEYGYDENGDAATYLTTKQPLRDADNKIIGLFGLSVDITEQKRIERDLEKAKAQAELASTAKSEFIYNMSHDLRTPFSGILGFAHHLYEHETDSSKKQKLSYIIQSSEKLLSLLNEILHAAKGTSIEKINEVTFDVIELIHECKALFIAETERKNLKFKLKSTAPVLFIKTDKHRIHRILINLLSNAIKFTNQGSVEVSVSTLFEDDQTFLMLSVADTGIGIATTHKELIFERFTRLSSEHHPNRFGTGMGLWFVKRMIEEMHGSIKVSSQEGVGTTFSCKIPVIPQPNIQSFTKQMTQPHAHAKSATTKEKPLSILMVEDDEITQRMQSMMLKEYGHQIDIAYCGEIAIELAKEKTYDLILMDIGLPGADGFTVADNIRSQCPKQQHTPIIGLTAHIGQIEQERWGEEKIDKLILKPLTKTVCSELITNIIEVGKK